MCLQVRLELVGPVECARAVGHIALVLLHRVVRQQMSLQLVASIESRRARGARKRLLARVDDDVHLQVVGRLERLITIATRVGIGAVCHQMPTKVALARKDLRAMGTRISMRCRLLVLVQRLLRAVPTQARVASEESKTKNQNKINKCSKMT